MPSRVLVIAIVVFWAATMALLFVREIAPRLENDEPALFAVDKADELKKKPGSEKKMYWRVFRTSGEHYRLTTSVLYKEDDDSFELVGRLARWGESESDRAILRAAKLPLLEVQMGNTYRFDREGRLAELFLTTQYRMARPQLPERATLQTIVKLLDTTMRHGSFGPTVSVEIKDTVDETETALEPVEVSRKGNVLNPLHPVNRMVGLRPRQTWNCVVVDPFFIDVVRSDLSKQQPDAGWGSFLPRDQSPLLITQARVRNDVLPDFQWLGKDVPCFVVDFGTKGSLMHLTTYVRASDGLVLQQETVLWGDSWTIRRIAEPETEALVGDTQPPR
jgi:hypothetical protein